MTWDFECEAKALKKSFIQLHMESGFSKPQFRKNIGMRPASYSFLMAPTTHSLHDGLACAAGCLMNSNEIMSAAFKQEFYPNGSHSCNITETFAWFAEKDHYVLSVKCNYVPARYHDHPSSSPCAPLF